jgi:hypothetical protein
MTQTLNAHMNKRKKKKTGEQISGMWYSHSHPWDKPA